MKVQTTKEQAKIAKETGQALFVIGVDMRTCKDGERAGCVTMDGPISAKNAKKIIRFMSEIANER